MVFLRVILVLSLLAILPGLVLPDGIWRDIAFLAAILAVASGIIVLRSAGPAQPPRTPRPKRRRKGRPIVVEGRWDGAILHERRGDGGHGYDPVFLDPVHGQTAAEMSRALKNRLSHRGQALALLRERLLGSL